MPTSGPAAPVGGPFAPGDRVQLSDTKGKLHTVTLEAGKLFHTHKGAIAHDDLHRASGGSRRDVDGGRRLPRPATAAVGLRAVDAAWCDRHLPQGRRPDRRGRRHLSGRPSPRGRRRIGGAHLLAAPCGGCSGVRSTPTNGATTSRRGEDERDHLLRSRAVVVDADRRRPRRGDHRRSGRPGGARHARALGVHRCRRGCPCAQAGCSAATSPRRPSCRRRSRPCASTAASPSRRPARPWCGPGTSRDWRCGRTTG